MPLRYPGLVLTVLVLAGLIGCGGGSDAPSSPRPAAGAASPVDEATAGSVAGRVVLQGQPPAPDVLSMSADPSCLSAGGEALTEYFVVSDDGGLENVFVYVKSGLEGLTFAPPATAARLDQRGCRYVPHVLGVQIGQPLDVSNSDDTLHNVHAVPDTNAEFNVGQPVKGMTHTQTFTAREIMVRFKCDVHGWMNAYVGVLEHPYFAVTAGGGRFDIRTLPPGTYEIEAWHEKLGTQVQTVTVGEKETKEITFTFSVGQD